LTQPPVEQPPEAPAAAEEPAAENPMPEPKSTDEASRSTPEPQPAVDEQTLSDLESAVDSPHVTDKPNESQQVDNTSSDADAALAAAHQAFDAAETDTTERPAAFNASGPMEIAHDESVAEATPAEPAVSSEPASVAIDPATGELSYPSNLVPPSTGLPSDPTAASVEDPTAPPPVPPPMAMPPLMPPVEPPADPNNLPPVNP
jgi:tRNA pseudouridine55 synthase